MKKTFWYSTAGVVVLIIGFVLVNWLATFSTARVDLTAGSVYTLSDATRNILHRLKEPVHVRFFYTRGDDAIPIQVRVFARRVEDLLGEYKQVAGDRLILEKFNPEPDTDAEDQATLTGIDAQTTPAGDRFYLGISVEQGGQKSTIPALDGNREALLEYDLTRAITRVSNRDKPVIGLMSPLPLAGNPMAMMMGQGAPQPQVVYSQLEQDYTIRKIGLDATEIPPEVKLLLVIHPRGISEQAEYAIDQFVLRGGRLVAFVDPLAYFDQQPSPMGMMPGGPSSLEHLFKGWGIAMDKTKVVLDIQYGAGSGNRAMPTVLALDGPAISRTDVTTSGVPNLLVPMAGAFTGTPVQGLQESVLLKSSKSSVLVASEAASRQGRDALRGFTAPSGVEYPMAIRLSGRFKTAFPEGPPPKPEPKPAAEAKTDAKASNKAADKASGKAVDKAVDKSVDKAAGSASAAEKAAEAPAAVPLKEAAEDNSVVLVADTDLLNDGAAVSIQELFGRRIVIPSNGNLSFFLTLVEQMSGDPALARLSSRAVASRPLTLVRQMEAQAEQAYLGQLKSLEDSLNQTKEKLQELEKAKQPGTDGKAAATLSAEEQAEVDNFRKKSVETRRELKNVRKALRADTESLEFWTKVVNIGLMPLVIALAGIAFAFGRRQRSRSGA
jgi:ABC-type uncharacterized transport system involved in gliding motility auxiliary subunit